MMQCKLSANWTFQDLETISILPGRCALRMNFEPSKFWSPNCLSPSILQFSAEHFERVWPFCARACFRETILTI